MGVAVPGRNPPTSSTKGSRRETARILMKPTMAGGGLEEPGEPSPAIAPGRVFGLNCDEMRRLPPDCRRTSSLRVD